MLIYNNLLMKYIQLVLLFVIGCNVSFIAYAETHHPQEFLKSVLGAKDEGQQIVQHFCATCHALDPMIPMGAPREGSKVDWSPRLKQGLKSLFQHTSEGINAMPARGGCFECTDRQLMLAILEMLPNKALAEDTKNIK
jgi:cytochrome c5